MALPPGFEENGNRGVLDPPALRQHDANRFEESGVKTLGAKSLHRKPPHLRMMTTLEGIDEEHERSPTMKSGKGGYVDLTEVIRDLKDSDFEGAHNLPDMPMGNRRLFHFELCTQKSILMELGLDVVGSNLRKATAMEVYTKSSDKMCVNLLLAMIIGMGSVHMPTAVAKCGLIPGAVTIVVLSQVVHFLCHRFAEVPQLVEQNFENLNSAIRLLLKGAFSARVVAYCTVVFWGMEAGYLASSMADIAQDLSLFLMNYPLNDRGEPVAETRVRWGSRILVFCICYPLASTARNIKAAERFITCAIYSTVVSFGLQTLLAIYNGFALRPPEDTPRLWPTNLLDFLSGVSDLTFEYGGILVLPYLIAEMSETKHAKKVLSKAITRLTYFYLAIGLLGYWGWGTDLLVRRSGWPIDLSHLNSVDQGVAAWRIRFTQTSIVVFRFLLMAKILCSIPLLFWPLWREVEVLSTFSVHPGIEVQLPWAIEQRKIWWSRWRYLTAGGVVGLLLIPRGTQEILSFIWISSPLANFLFPAAIAVAAVHYHGQIEQGRELRSTVVERIRSKGYAPGVSYKPEVRNPVFKYFGGKFQNHYLATVAVWVAIFVTMLALIRVRVERDAVLNGHILELPRLRANNP